ncbi:hypothetical protein HK100_002001 [Physocladia obscura]|uniref:Uncharacterized protein n=1 Tax=Physocladia obscura TaxID=109957 RepID=A0AAD5SXN2_9FUNG|nr:hypothetical protein HK100_002001 [Physocladia obscura]
MVVLALVKITLAHGEPIPVKEPVFVTPIGGQPHLVNVAPKIPIGRLAADAFAIQGLLGMGIRVPDLIPWAGNSCTFVCNPGHKWDSATNTCVGSAIIFHKTASNQQCYDYNNQDILNAVTSFVMGVLMANVQWACHGISLPHMHNKLQLSMAAQVVYLSRSNRGRFSFETFSNENPLFVFQIYSVSLHMKYIELTHLGGTNRPQLNGFAYTTSSITSISASANARHRQMSSPMLSHNG